MFVFRSACPFKKTDSGVLWFPWGYKANTKGSNNRLLDLKQNVFIFGQTYSAGLSVKKNFLFKAPNHLWVLDVVAGVKKLGVSTDTKQQSGGATKVEFYHTIKVYFMMSVNYKKCFELLEQTRGSQRPQIMA